MKFEFNKDRLQRMLSSAEIDYIHIPELAIPREKRQSLKNDKDYEKLFVEYAFELKSMKTYLEQVISLGQTKRIGIMCFERNPQMCHRREIGKYLESQGYIVNSL